MVDSTTSGEVRRPHVELVIPDQVPAPEDSFLLNPREVHRWAEELPVANIGETARQVYKTLVTFNRIQIPTLTRTEIIELFREPVRYINANITRHYLNVGFPLSSKARKAAQLASALCSEVANSYKILFLDQVLGDEQSFNQKLVIVAAQRAIQYLGQKMNHSLLVYHEYPQGLWQEANYLYAWASQNHVEKIPVKENSSFILSRKTARSIEDAYKAMALMTTTAPHRLRQSQIRRIHERLPQWAELAEVKPVQDAPRHAGVFYLNLWSDNPPQKSLSQSERNDSRFLALDLNGALEHARAEFEQAEWESPTHIEHDRTILSRSLLKPLIHGWNKSLERKFPRSEQRKELEAIVGLSNLLRLLDSQRSQEDTPKNATQASGHATPSSKLTWNDSVFSTLAIASPAHGSGEDSIFGESTNLASTLLGTPGEHEVSGGAFNQPPKQPESPFAVLTYNESLEGYCLGWKRSYPMKVRVGDVLGVRSPTNPEEYGVAVTRWLKHKNEDELYLGLQILTSHAIPVIITPSPKPSSNRMHQYQCLLLSGHGKDEEQQGILTNTHVFELDKVISMTTEFGQHQIRLTKWIESSNNFVHYHFEYIDDKTADDTAGNEVENDFKDLWDEL